MTFEGDLIRPLGLVTLYAAYAEFELDEILDVLFINQPFDDAKRGWTVGRKLTYAQKLVRELKAENLAGLVATLKEARILFEKRNSLIHGCIYAGGRVVSNRRNVPNQQVSARELTELAELIFACKEKMFMHRSKHLMPLLGSI